VKPLELGFFGLCALLVVLGGLSTVAARNPIRSAMGLLTTIVGVAGMYLMLSAEFLAAIQILVYAGAVVVLFIFVIMLLGPSAMSPRDARSAIPRYIGAGVFLAASLGALALALGASAGPTQLPKAPASFGTIEGIGRELFTAGIVPFELSGALLLVAVVGAVAVARGKQIDPTLHSAGRAEAGDKEQRP
jgi:NADH-quinone oxidoreductase subunit J